LEWAEHLRLCLPSLASQSFRSLEIIVVDNRSPEDSAEVARTLEVHWLLLEENIGLAPALNRGAAIAGGLITIPVERTMLGARWSFES
jgi:GT2 family glycosyltransferase